MPRGLRVHVPNGWYHVTSRGNGGDAIFRTGEDRRRFLRLVAELPGRFRTEVHAFVLMDNHYHLLLRCRGASISENLRWLQTTYAARFNWAHQRHGHLFQGRFKSVLIHDDGALDRVARYLHLNPVRIGGLGLGKKEQQHARVLGCEDPGAELVARRVKVLREYFWSSWRVYAGLDNAPEWLTTERIQAGCGGAAKKAQRRSLTSYTEAPIRQGALEDPWEGVVAGAVLGERDEALAILRAAGRQAAAGPERARTLERESRPGWIAIVREAEKLLGRKWDQMAGSYGDWGRDGTIAVATRALGWRLVEVVKELNGLGYAAAAQGLRRFWKQSESRPELAAFARKLEQSVVNNQ